MSSGMLFVINLDDLLFPENQKPKQNKQIIILKKERREKQQIVWLKVYVDHKAIL